jgi:hypothetical protein
MDLELSNAEILSCDVFVNLFMSLYSAEKWEEPCQSIIQM